MADEPTRSMSEGSDPDRTRATVPDTSSDIPHPKSDIPSRIGRYTIVRVLGEGGMGTVYEARQQNPDRTVALKVIRAGQVSPELLRRFDLESQVLARLQHPGIAQVYDAGTVEDARGHPVPFFAMEFIKGVQLTNYAERNDLGTRDRLELVAKICDAVYHAHQKGVIHRDLKPGNIIVDESGQPKILDFGVARATDSDIQQTTQQTDIGQLIGTVPYMSPEQVSGDPGDLDTRSDVYALGVIAYELLAGRLPYDLHRKMIAEAARIIKEEEPTRLSNINRTLRGDVETIVAKALEKDKVRRYQSAESFASDIRRYLKDEPIAARPASAWYQVQKFSRRNTGLVSGVAAAFVLLIAGVIGTSLALRRALKAEAETRLRAEELQQVSDFQNNMLKQVDPTAAGIGLTADITARLKDSLTRAGVPENDQSAQVDAFLSQWRRVNATDAARELLDRTIFRPAITAIDTQFKAQPLLDSRLRETLSDRYRDIGLFSAAFPLAEQAVATRRRVQGGEHPDTLNAINSMGALLVLQGKLSEAEPLAREAVDMRRRILGDDHPHTLSSQSNLGGLLQLQGKLGEAETVYLDTLARDRRIFGDDHTETLTVMTNLGLILQSQGKLAEAEVMLRQVLEARRRAHPDDAPNLLNAVHHVGFILQHQGRPAEAEPYIREALDGCRRLMGEEHPATITAINDLGAFLLGQGRPAEAEPLYRESMEKSRRVLGDDHSDTLTAFNNMGYLLVTQHRLDEAEPLLVESIERCRRVLGEEHFQTVAAISNLGRLRYEQNRLPEAEAIFNEVLEKSRRTLGDDNPSTLEHLGFLGITLREQSRFSEAEPLLREVLDKRRRVLGEDNDRTLNASLNLAMLLYMQGKLAEAEPVFVDGLARFRRIYGEDHPTTVGTINNLGALMWAQHKLPEARPYFTEAAEKSRRLLGESHPDALTAAGNLGYLLTELGAYTEAEPVLLQASATAEASLPPGHPVASKLISNTCRLYAAWDKAEPGKGYDTKTAEWKAKLDALTPPAPTSPPPGG